MQSASESLHIIIRAAKALKAGEVQEAAISTNRPWVSATGGKRPKRDAPTHTPIDGDFPETYFCFAERMLHNVSRVMLAQQRNMEHTLKGIRPSANVLEERRKAALKEVDVSPVEIAFLYSYSSDKPVRELRTRHGLDPNTGRPQVQKYSVALGKKVRR